MNSNSTPHGRLMCDKDERTSKNDVSLGRMVKIVLLICILISHSISDNSYRMTFSTADIGTWATDSNLFESIRYRKLWTGRSQ